MEGAVGNIVAFCVLCFCSLSEGNNIAYRIEEELPSHTIIGDISKEGVIHDRYAQHDLDKLRYSFLSPEQDETQYFEIEESTGVLKTALKLDRDAICYDEEICILSVDIAISPAQFFYSFTIHVELLDLNDNVPSFGTPAIYLRLSESSRIGKVLLLPQAEDPDTSQFTIKSYNIITTEDIPFNLERSVALDGTTELKLVLTANIDREEKAFYSFAITAEDGGNPPRGGTLDVNITVEDTNDHVPVFERQSYATQVLEDAAIRSTITTVSAYDSDIGPNGQIIFALAPRTDERYGHLFGIDEVSGDLYIRQQLDFEFESIYHLVITASDRGPDAQTARITVTVNVLDINDFVPMITINTFTESAEAEVEENVDRDTFVAHVSVRDEDGGEAGEVNCGIDSHEFELKPLDTQQFTIVTREVFDREVRHLYVIYLRCHDLGAPRLDASYNLTVRIADANDHSPHFSKTLYSAEIYENEPEGKIIFRISASDEDIGENADIEYSLSDNNVAEIFTMFAIEPASGAVLTLASLDHERNQSINFEVSARDHGDPQRSAVAQVSIHVNDLNDNPPVFTQQAGYSFGLRENLLAGEEISNVVAVDNDSDPFDIIRYKLKPMDFDPEGFGVHEKFQIDFVSGYLSARVPLDREEQDVYYMQVLAQNPGTEMVGTASVTIYVTDENDNSPIIDFPSAVNNTVYVRNDAQLQHVITRIRANDLDFDANAMLSFSLPDSAADMSPLFEVDATTGAVTVNADLSDMIDMEFNLTIEAEDHGSPPRRQSALLVIVVTDANSPWGSPKEAEDENSNGALPNFGIVIGVACGSTIVIALLALAIIIISCKGKSQARKSSAQYQGQYNCRTTEAQRMLNGRPDNRSASEGSGSQPNSPHKPVPDPPGHVLGPNDVHVDVSYNAMGRDPSLCGSRTQNQPGDTKQTWLTSELMDGHKTLASIGTPRNLHVCDTYVQATPKPGGGGAHDKFATTLVPLTDKEIEIHKVLKFLHSQQDDAESGCSETMSTSDSGRGNSVSEETPENGHPRAPHHKHVHFMPVPGAHAPHLDRDYARTNGAISPAFRSNGATSPACRSNGATSPAFRNNSHSLSSQPHHRQNLSTFSSPNAKNINKYAHAQNNGKRPPARVSFQCPPYDVLTPSHKQRTLSSGTILAPDVSSGTMLAPEVSVPMCKIDECVSSTENLSDDSASTMSGSYVLQQEDGAHIRASTPTGLSPAICRVLPTIQDSVV